MAVAKTIRRLKEPLVWRMRLRHKDSFSFCWNVRVYNNRASLNNSILILICWWIVWLRVWLQRSGLILKPETRECQLTACQEVATIRNEVVSGKWNVKFPFFKFEFDPAKPLAWRTTTSVSCDPNYYHPRVNKLESLAWEFPKSIYNCSWHWSLSLSPSDTNGLLLWPIKCADERRKKSSDRLKRKATWTVCSFVEQKKDKKY